MCPPQRRDLLALAGATATSLAAGCLSTGHGEFNYSATFDDQTTNTDEAAGNGDATATVDGEFAATTWLPASDVLGDQLFFVFAGDLDAPREAGVTDSALARTYESMLALPTAVSLGDVVTEFATVQGYATACRYDAPTSEIRDRLAARTTAAKPTATAREGTSADASSEVDSTGDADASPNGDAPDGYEGYVTDHGTYWLGADHLLFGKRRRLVEALLDARAGDVERYASNQDFGAVLDVADDVDLLGGAPASQQVVDSAVAYAYGWRFGDRVSLLAPFAFEEAGATDADAVATLGEYAGFAEYERTDVRTDGRVVTFTGELPVDEFDLLERDDGGTVTGGGDAPQVSFSFEYHRGDDGDGEERVVVTHQGGDNVDLANVALHYDGSDIAKSDAFASTKPTGETWAAGGEWTLRVDGDDAAFESGATVEVVWTSDDGGRSVVLAMIELP